MNYKKNLYLGIFIILVFGSISIVLLGENKHTIVPYKQESLTGVIQDLGKEKKVIIADGTQEVPIIYTGDHISGYYELPIVGYEADEGMNIIFETEIQGEIIIDIKSDYKGKEIGEAEFIEFQNSIAGMIGKRVEDILFVKTNNKIYLTFQKVITNYDKKKEKNNSNKQESFEYAEGLFY